VIRKATVFTWKDINAKESSLTHLPVEYLHSELRFRCSMDLTSLLYKRIESIRPKDVNS